MKYISILIVVFTILIITANSLSAGCFRAKPLPKCDNFWLTETHIMYRLDNNELEKWHKRGVYRIAFGRMFNKNSRYALGGTISMLLDDVSNEGRFYLGGRGRKWVSPKIAIDASIALPISSKMFSFSRFLISVSASKDDYFGVSATMEQVKRRGISDTNWSAGVKFGSDLGIIISVFAAVLLIARIMSDMGNMNIN